MNNKNKNPISTAITDLVSIVEQLRDPINGCPWDKEQTHTSLIPYVLEEAHEVADAIRQGDDKNLNEELGDLLLQVVLHSQIASEGKRFSLKEVAQGINRKLIRRHPHVFGKVSIKSNEKIKESWEEIKISEKPLPDSKSPLSDRIRNKIRSQPSLTGAMYISQKASQVGFEWDSFDDVWKQLNEELEELKEALTKKNYTHAEEELGDVLFTLINIARWCKMNPDEGLRSTNSKFLDRFSYMEAALNGQLIGQPLNKLEELWEAAKIYFQSKASKKNNQ